MKDKLLRWLLVFIVAFSTFNFSFLKNPQTASAHDVYYMSVLINPSSYEYQAFVLHDKESGMSKESKHTEYSLGDFRDVAQNAIIPGEVKEKKYTDGKPPMYFSFPAYEQGERPGGKAKNHASSVDYDRAETVSKTIIGGLNGAMQIVYEGEQATSFDELRKRTNSVLSALNGNGTVNGWKFRKGRIVPNQKMTEDGLRNDDWVTISKDGQKYEFPYRMMKGYKLPGGVNSSQLPWHDSLVNDHTYSDDVVYVTWSRVAYQAWYSMDVNGHSSNHLNEIRRVGKLEEAVVELAESGLRQLRDLLGLYPMNELVYNEGIRGSNFWYYGVMPDIWANNMNKYYNLFQGIAWTLIIFSLAKLLIQRNLSIVNPAMRVSLMEGVQDLVITALALVFLMPLMNFVLTMNYRLVDIFATLKTHGDVFSEVNNYSGAIGGILLQIFYFFIEIWLNFTYIVRGITLAIMMMMAPLFVVSISLGGKWKNLFGTFCREFVGHVFIQSFHAMIIAFLLSTSVMTRGIETAVTLFALIALTNFFRAMVFGQGGDFAGKMGVSSAAGMVALGASTAKAASNQRKQSSAKRSQSSGGSFSSSNGGDRNADGSINVGGGNSFSATSRNNQAASTMNVSGSGGDGGQSGNLASNRADGGMSTNDIHSGNDSGQDSSGSLANEGFAVGHNPKVSRAAIGGALATGAGAGYVGAKLMGSAAYGMAFGSEQGPQAFNRFHSGSEKPNLPPGKRSGGQGGSVGGASGQGGGTNSSGGPVNPGVNGGYSLQPDNEMAVGGDSGGSLESGGIRSYTVSREGDSANIEYDGGWMSDRGITGVETTAQGHTTLNYSQGSMNEDQIADANYYAEAFEKGNEKEIRTLRENGIQSARKKADGSYAITYNQTGKEKMGFKSLDRQSDGHYQMNRSSEQTGSAPHLFLKRYRPQQEQQSNNGEDQGIPRV